MTSFVSALAIESPEMAVAPQDASAEDESFSPERITTLTSNLADKMESVIRAIQKINVQSRILSLNALVEAARAGEAGQAFGIVASEMGALEQEISSMVHRLEEETMGDLRTIAAINERISTEFRGTRLSDLALMNIDLIDRNLYERSCDVRWWATDPSLVDALTEQNDRAHDFASHRLSVILDSYTVYFDLVLCNREGIVVANGRPQDYPSTGRDVADQEWFQAGMETATGEDFAWQTVHRSSLVNNQLALIYSTAIRSGGAANGAVLGALGIVFRYEDLAQTIVDEVPLTKEEKQRCRVLIVDRQGLVLADSEKQNLRQTIPLDVVGKLFGDKKSFTLTRYEGRDCCIAHAKAPGYETYTTGWHSLIIERLATKRRPRNRRSRR